MIPVLKLFEFWAYEASFIKPYTTINLSISETSYANGL